MPSLLAEKIIMMNEQNKEGILGKVLLDPDASF